MDGHLLLIDKSAGWTSHDVVNKVRGIFHTRRVGHAGTLDPFATGLLIVGVGPATKQLTALVGTDKTYIATATLGATSTTDDPEGVVTEKIEAGSWKLAGQDGTLPDSSFQIPDSSEIVACLNTFLGTHEQTAPAFSAKKVGGKKLYELARKGLAHTVELPKKMVTIHSIKLLSYEWPTLTFEVSVSSGTYIRVLARNIGERLMCGAYLTALRRTKVGDFRIEDAKTLEQLAAGRTP